MNGIVVHDIGPVKIEPAPVQPPSLQWLRSYSDWRRSWTHIVSGKFSASLYSGLLFYDPNDGVAEFYETDGQGGVSLLRHYEDWRGSWTLIVAGTFGDSGFSGLLLYDQAAGFGALYDTDGHGNIILLREYDDWRTTWTQIVVGCFTDSRYSGILFYDGSAGYGETYTTDGHGGLSQLNSHPEWRTTWTRIVAGEFYFPDAPIAGPVIDDLFFYEGETGYGETYMNDGNGGMDLVASQSMPTATTIVPGSFGGSGFTNLLFYDETTGRATFQDLGPEGWSSLEDYVWGRNWDITVPGNFWMADPDQDQHFPDGAFTDLLFYDRMNGHGEFYLHEPVAPTPLTPLMGYVSPRSLQAGETICFHVSSAVGPYAINIYRQDVDQVFMASVTGLTPAGGPLPIGRTAYKGADWPSVGEFTIPADWPSGLYFARVQVRSILEPATDGEIGIMSRVAAPGYERRVAGLPQIPPYDIPFVVRASERGMQARILFAIQDTTYEAYNYWGGRSLYGYGHGGHGDHTWAFPQTAIRAPYAFRVSFRRPHTGLAEKSKKWQFWEVPFLQWLARQGIRVDVCAISDLYKDSNLLSNYRLFVCAGHSEYWSKEMRDNVESFVKNGGNAAFFGGNISWWQVRFEDGGDTMVCYKNKDFDPQNLGAPLLSRRVTVNWFDDPVKRPETSLTGVSYYGTPIYPGDPSSQFYVARDADHWVFDNTGFLNGAPFGDYENGTKTVVGTETDKRQDNDLLRSPANFHTLATVSLCRKAEENIVCDEETGTMGIFTNGHGTVFTASTINWALGLSQDCSWNPIDLITRNVLIRLG